MSRAVITDIHGAGVEAREELRRRHGMRLVAKNSILNTAGLDREILPAK